MRDQQTSIDGAIAYKATKLFDLAIQEGWEGFIKAGAILALICACIAFFFFIKKYFSAKDKIVLREKQFTSASPILDNLKAIEVDSKVNSKDISSLIENMHKLIKNQERIDQDLNKIKKMVFEKLEKKSIQP